MQLNEELLKCSKDLASEVSDIPVDLRAIAYKVLLTAHIGAPTGGSMSGVAGASGSGPRKVEGIVGDALVKWADRYAVTMEQVQRVLEFEESGFQVIAKLSTKVKSHIQEALALLIGVGHIAVEGIGTIPKNDLIEACKEYAGYDQPNFSSHMRKRKNLFGSESEGNWKLTRPGEERAADMIKEIAGA